MRYALNDPRTVFVFFLYCCIEMYVKMCISCTNEDRGDGETWDNGDFGPPHLDYLIIYKSEHKC